MCEFGPGPGSCIIIALTLTLGVLIHLPTWHCIGKCIVRMRYACVGSDLQRVESDCGATEWSGARIAAKRFPWQLGIVWGGASSGCLSAAVGIDLGGEPGIDPMLVKFIFKDDYGRAVAAACVRA